MKSQFRTCLLSTCFSVAFLTTAAASIHAAPTPAPAVAAGELKTTVFTQSATMLAQNDESSGSGRVSGRGMRGLGKLVVFAVLALFGAGKWIFSKFTGGE